VGALTVAVRTAAAPAGARVVVDLALDGASLATGAGEVRDGRAEVAVSLPDRLRWAPWGEPPPVVQCVARLLDGSGRALDRRSVRCALGSVSYRDGALSLDGQRVHLLAAKMSQLGPDARDRLGQLWPRLRTAGINSLEAHGWVPDPDLVEAAEELGLALVVLPRCPALVARPLAERLEADREGALLAPLLATTVTWLERSPAVVLWEREKFWLPLPDATRPVASGGSPDIGPHPVAVAGARYGSRVDLYGDPEAPGSWIIEMIPEDPTRPEVRNPRAVNELARTWLVGDLGYVLPCPYTTDGLLTSPEDEVQALGQGLEAEAIGDTRRRGPSLVRVSVERQGRPCWGAPVLLEVEGLPPLAAATDPDGVAEIELFWQGPARVSLGPAAESVDLVPGYYEDGGWRPAVREVGFSLAD
jgi:hypothetical protein